MTARATITESELRRMAKIVKSEGVRVGTEINGRVYWVAPEQTKPPTVDEQEEIRL